MRTHLSERASKELLEIMKHYGFTSTNHTLNVVIGNLYKTLNLNTPDKEVIEHGNTTIR